MYLINTETLELEEFLTEDGLEYAILSHRWGKEEVLFKDQPFLEKARKKHGFAKLKEFCEIAASKGYKYAWMDTCCIDKSSSAELSEAINSMYRWYQRAAVCFAYLADVHHDNKSTEFEGSEWFKRGWTLQELLGPANLIFYDLEWKKLGDKVELVKWIGRASAIDKDALCGSKSLQSFSIAERMSWASQRVTTRPEDTAYCLLGIFDVNMPLLYGEGEKAFLRLQEQIMKESFDESIFAWSETEDTVSGLLAKSPASFHNIRGKKVFSQNTHGRILQAPALTGYGLSIELRLYLLGPPNYYFASIPVDVKPRFPLQSIESVYVVLARVSNSEPGQYVRVQRKSQAPTIYLGIKRPSVSKTIFVLQKHPLPSLGSYVRRNSKPITNAFRILPAVVENGQNLQLIKIDTLGAWDGAKRSLTMSPGQLGTAGILKFVLSGKTKRSNWDECPSLILLGFGFDFTPVCVIVSEKGRSSLSSRKSFHPNSPWDLPGDISKTEITDITCFEGKGWSELIEKKDVWGVKAYETKNRGGFWAFKLGIDREQLYVSFGDNGWVFFICLREYWDQWTWTVALGNDAKHQPASYFNM